TREIRIYLEGGDDHAEVRGVTDSGPTVRIVGGGGKDELIDESHVKGFFLDIIPIRQAETKTYFYDSGEKTVFKRGRGTKIVRDKVPKPKTDLEKYEPGQRDRDTEIYGAPIFSFNTDDGFVFGGSALFYKFGFRAKPYDYWFSLNGSYATKTSSHHFNFHGIFTSLIKGAAVHLEILKTQLLFNDYYGFGNETNFDKELEKDKYYRTEEEFFIVRPSVHFKLFKNTKAVVGFSYTYSDIALGDLMMLKGTHHYRYGLGKFQSLALISSLQYDGRDKSGNPHKGFFLKLDGSYAPEWTDNRYAFFKSGFDMRFYLPINIFRDMTAAFRVGGSKVWGDYPFFNAVFLGGAHDLRGYNRKRFSGDAALFGQVELRTYLGRVKLIFPGRLGFHVFSDMGRVFKDGESSDTWHSSYGGGLWLSFADRMLNTSITFAKSPEKLTIYFALKLMY
ncbi:MAG: BamA/TamA family outer membrane protein, partial [bacterium]|nr:BamA/TamA family outer membrane protein [bacterium]